MCLGDQAAVHETEVETEAQIWGLIHVGDIQGKPLYIYNEKTPVWCGAEWWALTRAWFYNHYLMINQTII